MTPSSTVRRTPQTLPVLSATRAPSISSDNHDDDATQQSSPKPIAFFDTNTHDNHPVTHTDPGTSTPTVTATLIVDSAERMDAIAPPPLSVLYQQQNNAEGQVIDHPLHQNLSIQPISHAPTITNKIMTSTNEDVDYSIRSVTPKSITTLDIHRNSIIDESSKSTPPPPSFAKRASVIIATLSSILGAAMFTWLIFDVAAVFTSTSIAATTVIGGLALLPFAAQIAILATVAVAFFVIAFALMKYIASFKKAKEVDLFDTPTTPISTSQHTYSTTQQNQDLIIPIE